jgi:hypothetical protein
MIPAIERLQTDAFDRTATGTDTNMTSQTLTKYSSLKLLCLYTEVLNLEHKM